MGRFVGVTLRAFPFLPTPIPLFFSSPSAKTSRQRYAVVVSLFQLFSQPIAGSYVSCLHLFEFEKHRV